MIVALLVRAEGARRLSFDFSRRRGLSGTDIPMTASLDFSRRSDGKDTRIYQKSFLPRQLHSISAVAGAVDENVRDPCTYSAFREWSCRV